MTDRVPQLRQTVIDTTDTRALAEFYRQFLGYHYRPGDEPPAPGGPDPQAGWLVLHTPGGASVLAFQRVEELPEVTWPDGAHPQMLHLDLTVPDVDELEHQRERALSLGAWQLLDRTDDPDEPLYVFADPSGHPFCVFVG
ncbi:VOC family protein [Pseudonocardia endophytica]|uniref:Glyoxalase/bleomycin resistance protein/dioxygenase superfamily protein n=1 Tax=Pseudonocardia endophytica TaxID=401976 RepID=A0A4R1HPC1_PSEEN|nr:VOC family protein [Pseudonocardia endophytica]TCK22505.1 glyoxalase/bleomycin resistance protein/dioxygenase superfamily protein [Pseudonocardia endophytica]